MRHGRQPNYSQFEAEGYDRVRVLQGNGLGPFKMIRERIPMLSAMTLDQLGAKMKCDQCGKPELFPITSQIQSRPRIVQV